jgi:hypothetical protein
VDVNKSLGFKQESDIATATTFLAHALLIIIQLLIPRHEVIRLNVDGQSCPLLHRLHPGTDRKVQFGLQCQEGHPSHHCRDPCPLCAALVLHRRLLHFLLVIHPICWHSKRCPSSIQARFSTNSALSINDVAGMSHHGGA